MRDSMTIIVALNNGKQSFHFTQQPLAGNDNWFKVLDNDLFLSIENILIENGVAHNLTLLSELRKNNETSSDYKITYNLKE